MKTTILRLDGDGFPGEICTMTSLRTRCLAVWTAAELKELSERLDSRALQPVLSHAAWLRKGETLPETLRHYAGLGEEAALLETEDGRRYLCAPENVPALTEELRGRPDRRGT